MKKENVRIINTEGMSSEKIAKLINIGDKIVYSVANIDIKSAVTEVSSRYLKDNFNVHLMNNYIIGADRITEIHKPEPEGVLKWSGLDCIFSAQVSDSLFFDVEDCGQHWQLSVFQEGKRTAELRLSSDMQCKSVAEEIAKGELK
jgi:hypothetical protein